MFLYVDDGTVNVLTYYCTQINILHRNLLLSLKRNKPFHRNYKTFNIEIILKTIKWKFPYKTWKSNVTEVYEEHLNTQRSSWKGTKRSPSRWKNKVQVKSPEFTLLERGKQLMVATIKKKEIAGATGAQRVPARESLQWQNNLDQRTAKSPTCWSREKKREEDWIKGLKIKRAYNRLWQAHSVKVVPSQRRFCPRKSSSRERNDLLLPAAACSDQYRRKLKIPRWLWWSRCYSSCNPEVLSAGPRPSTIGRRSGLLDFQKQLRRSKRRSNGPPRSRASLGPLSLRPRVYLRANG